MPYDEKNEVTLEISSSLWRLASLSKPKRWRVVKIVERAVNMIQVEPNLMSLIIAVQEKLSAFVVLGGTR